MSSYPLTLPVSSTSPLGTLTHPTPTLWILELHSGVDNRLTTPFISDVLGKTLDIVEAEWRAPRDKQKPKDRQGGALIFVGKLSQNKFFSNGLDFPAVLKSKGTFFPQVFNPFLTRLLSFPLPTIAAINGHAFAGGFILSLACDYRIMTSGKAWGCMNENQFGAPLPPSFSALLTMKLPSAQIYRKCVLESYRFTAQELQNLGLVDELADGGSEGVLKAATKYAEKVAPLAKTAAWGVLKEGMYYQVLESCKAGGGGLPPEDHVSKL